MSYRLTVVRVDPHPKAGEALPYNERGGMYSVEQRYPDTVERTALTVELTDAEYEAVKRACIEAAK